MYQDGHYYEGEVLKGMKVRHGKGLYIGEDRLFEGYWKKNKLHGKILNIDEFGDYNISDYQNGIRYG